MKSKPRNPSITVIKAAAPALYKECPQRSTYVVISVDIETGQVDTSSHDTRVEAEEDYYRRGDPPFWRGLQILRVDTP